MALLMAQNSGFPGFDQAIRHFRSLSLGISRYEALQTASDSQQRGLVYLGRNNFGSWIGEVESLRLKLISFSPSMSTFKYVTQTLSGRRSPVVPALEVTRI